MDLEQLFTDREKELLKKFVRDDILCEAVKKVVLSAVYFEGTIKKTGLPRPMENFALAIGDRQLMKLTREQMGERLEAALIAVQLLNDGFARLHKFNIQEKKPEVERSNPGR